LPEHPEPAYFFQCGGRVGLKTERIRRQIFQASANRSIFIAKAHRLLLLNSGLLKRPAEMPDNLFCLLKLIADSRINDEFGAAGKAGLFFRHRIDRPAPAITRRMNNDVLSLFSA
jgi:hypothetical protein